MRLDRIEIEEAGQNPAQLAKAIHAQLGLDDGPVPVFDIARELDITDIRTVPLKGFEAALITTPERDVGAIALNADSSPRRRNFSLAHELGHFLSLWHKPVGDGAFQCSRKDMVERQQHNRHLRQETEANRFAIELLAPMRLMKPFLKPEPDLSQIIAVGERLDISKAAAARRYVELHADTLAVVFSQHGRMIACDRGEGFPFLLPRMRERLPELGWSGAEGQATQWDELDRDAWLPSQTRGELYGQTLRQAGGHALTLLSIEVEDDEE